MIKSGLFQPQANQDVVHYYNPAYLEFQRNRCLVLRKRTLPYVDHPHGFNQIVACPIMGDKFDILRERHLDFQDMLPHQHTEDPRVVNVHKEHFLLSATTFIRYPDNTWSGSHQILGLFDKHFFCLWSCCPQLGNNQPTVMMPVKVQEKNWLWFFTPDKNLCLWYSADPRWIVSEFTQYPWEHGDAALADRRDYIGNPLQWGFGKISGGTPPVLVDDLYWSFFHSWTYWPEGHEVKYYVGAFAFEAKPPYLPKKMTTWPLMSGYPMGLTRRDRRYDDRKEKLVVFPCGAQFNRGEWFVTMGINDQRCGWMRISHDELKKLTKDV